jgi:MFS family permease
MSPLPRSAPSAARFPFQAADFTVSLPAVNGAIHTAETYRYERWRAVTAGILETASTTFLLLIAVRWYQAGAIAKALVAAGGSVGLLLSPLSVWLVSRRGWPAAKAASRIAWAGAAVFLVMAALPFEPVFVLASVFALAATAAGIPLMTQIYQENYPENERGKLFSRTVMIRIATAAGFSCAAGQLLDRHMEQFAGLFVIFAGAFAFAAYCLARIPSRPIENAGGSHPLRAMRFAKSDAVFRRTLICWMLMGAANLMMWPLRVEYLANEQYGLTLSVKMIALLVGVVPNAARLVMSPLWGWLFDRMNFFVLRVVLNLGFALGIMAFFTSNTVPGLILGAVIFGISNAGGDVAWSLWVTKIAPPQRVAEYMSVHTFFTGVRGVLAPLLAFSLASPQSMSWLAAFCMGLIILASLMMLPEIKSDRAKRKAAALVEEVSD